MAAFGQSELRDAVAAWRKKESLSTRMVANMASMATGTLYAFEKGRAMSPENEKLVRAALRSVGREPPPPPGSEAPATEAARPPPEDAIAARKVAARRRIEKLRSERGLNKSEFARAIGIPTSSIALFVTGKQKFSLGFLERLEQALDRFEKGESLQAPAPAPPTRPPRKDQANKAQLDAFCEKVKKAKSTLDLTTRQLATRMHVSVQTFQAVVKRRRGASPAWLADVAARIDRVLAGETVPPLALNGRFGSSSRAGQRSLLVRELRAKLAGEFKNDIGALAKLVEMTAMRLRRVVKGTPLRDPDAQRIWAKWHPDEPWAGSAAANALQPPKVERQLELAYPAVPAPNRMERQPSALSGLNGHGETALIAVLTAARGTDAGAQELVRRWEHEAIGLVLEQYASRQAAR